MSSSKSSSGDETVKQHRNNNLYLPDGSVIRSLLAKTASIFHIFMLDLFPLFELKAVLQSLTLFLYKRKKQRKSANCCLVDVTTLVSFYCNLHTE